MILRFASLAGTTGLAALLTAVANTMTFFATQEASDDRLNTGHSLVRAATRDMTQLVTIAALLHTTIKRSASISKTGEILFSGGGPLVKQSGALSLVGGEIADCELLSDIALKVDVCPCFHACSFVIFLHGNHVDGVLASAELFLKLRVGVVWAGFGEDENGFLEVTDVALVAGLLEESPGFIFALLSDIGVVNCLGVLAIKRNVTWKQCQLWVWKMIELNSPS